MLQILMSMTMELAFVILFFCISIRASACKFFFPIAVVPIKIVVVVKIIIVIVLVCILHHAAPTRLDTAKKLVFTDYETHTKLVVNFKFTRCFIKNKTSSKRDIYWSKDT